MLYWFWVYSNIIHLNIYIYLNYCFSDKKKKSAVSRVEILTMIPKSPN